MSDGLRLEYLPLTGLKGAPRNPKQHAQGDIQTSINRFGYVEPIVLDERTGRLVAGHGRRDSLASLKAKGQEPPSGIKDDGGEWLVPVLRGWASRSDQEADAYLLASNQLTVTGGWDNGPLTEMLKELAEAKALDGVGFDAAALTELLDEAGPQAGNSDPDEVPEKRETDIQLGDLFQLGEHRLLCGDSTKAEDVDRVMAGDLAHICWTDPPYNLDLGQKAVNLGQKAVGRSIANDNMGAAFPGFCAAFSGEIARVLLPGGMMYLAMSTSEWPTIDSALRGATLKWSSTIAWVKNSLVMSRKDYHSQFEAIWYGWKDGAPRLCPLEDRKQSDVWEVARPKRSEEHPTMKPVELITRSLTNSSKRGNICFEPFSGSGSTLLACEQTGRKCRAIELEPQYVQVAIDRWEKFTGRKAVKVQDRATPTS